MSKAIVKIAHRALNFAFDVISTISNPPQGFFKYPGRYDCSVGSCGRDRTRPLAADEVQVAIVELLGAGAARAGCRGIAARTT